MRAVDLMTPLPEVALPDDGVMRVAEIMRDHDVGIVPVVADRETMRIVGVITDRDIVVRHVAAGHVYGCSAEDVMTAKPIYKVEPDANIEEILKIMRTEKVRRLLVVSPTGRLIGIVSQADLLLHTGDQYIEEVEHVLQAISEPVALQK